MMRTIRLFPLILLTLAVEGSAQPPGPPPSAGHRLVSTPTKVWGWSDGTSWQQRAGRPDVPPTNGNPSVSPDGRTIAFISTRTGNPDLFVINVDGTGERPLTQTPDAESKPQWSADSRWLRYAVSSGQAGELREVEVATGTARVIGSVPSRGVAVSPTGTLAAYTSGPWQTSRLAVARIDGSNERMLTTAEQTPIAWNPVFSPDEQWLAFTGQDSARNLQIFVVSLSTGQVRPVTQFTAEQGRAQVPSFSADGSLVAFQVNRKGASDVWLARRDGSQAPVPAVLANGLELNETPAWFPDGRALAIQSNRAGSMEIWVVGVDGTSPRQLTGLRAPDAGAGVSARRSRRGGPYSGYAK